MALPTDILKEIFQYCDNIEFYNKFVRTNKLFENVISIDKLIKLKFGEYNDFSLYYVLAKSIYFNWKNGYEYILNNYNIKELFTKYKTYCDNYKNEQISINIFGDIKIEVNIENKFDDFFIFKNISIIEILIIIYIYKNNDLINVFDFLYNNDLYNSNDIISFIDYYIEKLFKLINKNSISTIYDSKQFINIIQNKNLDKLITYKDYKYNNKYNLSYNIFDRKNITGYISGLNTIYGNTGYIYSLNTIYGNTIYGNIINNYSNNNIFQALVISTYILNKEYKIAEHYLKLIMPDRINGLIQHIYYLNDDIILKYIFVHTEMKTFYEEWNINYNIDYNNENDLIKYIRFLDYCKDYEKDRNVKHYILIK